MLLPKIKKIPTDGWLSQHQLGFLSLGVTSIVVLSCDCDAQHKCLDTLSNSNFIEIICKYENDAHSVVSVVCAINRILFLLI